MGDDGLGKKAEAKIRQWLNRPEDGYCFDRLPDQLSGFYGSKNICDFTLFKYPSFFYIESKATWQDSFSFDMISENQRTKMLEKSNIEGVYSLIICLFASYKRAFMFQIADIQYLLDQGKKSLNIKKEEKWIIPHVEIPTIPNTRKELLDYTGEIDELLLNLVKQSFQ